MSNNNAIEQTSVPTPSPEAGFPILPTPSSSLQPPASGLPIAAPPVPCAPSPNESPKAFEAFLVYFRLPGKRRLTTVARKTGAGVRSVHRWATDYDWAGRINQHRTRLLEQRAQAESALQQEEIIAWTDRSSALREREWEIADDLLTAIQTRLQAGDLDETALASLARSLALVSRIARLSAGLQSDSPLEPDATDPQDQAFEANLQTAYGDKFPAAPGASPDGSFGSKN